MVHSTRLLGVLGSLLGLGIAACTGASDEPVASSRQALGMPVVDQAPIAVAAAVKYSCAYKYKCTGGVEKIDQLTVSITPPGEKCDPDALNKVRKAVKDACGGAAHRDNLQDGGAGRRRQEGGPRGHTNTQRYNRPWGGGWAP